MPDTYRVIATDRAFADLDIFSTTSPLNHRKMRNVPASYLLRLKRALSKKPDRFRSCLPDNLRTHGTPSGQTCPADTDSASQRDRGSRRRGPSCGDVGCCARDIRRAENAGGVV